MAPSAPGHLSSTKTGGRFKTMTLELGEKVFMVEGAALQYAKDQTMALLQRQNAKAEIRFSPMRKAS